MSTESSSPSEPSFDSDHNPPATVPGPSAHLLTDEPRIPVSNGPFRDKPTADGKLPCGCSRGGRNLVVCIDGTANQFGKKNTNVVELYSRLVKDKTQLTYYNSGIGTYARPSWISWSYMKQFVYHFVDMAIAWNFEKIVLSAYQWLSENYEDGDRIFLFGFSRGAYQARVIAGMIHKVGLLHKGNNDQIPFAYELYIAATEKSTRNTEEEKKNDPPNSFHLAWIIHIVTLLVCFLSCSAYNCRIGLTEVTHHIDIWYIYLFVQLACVLSCTVYGLYSKDSDSLKEAEELCERFKTTLSRPAVKVHFVGAWDTVSSIGITRGPSLPETTTGMTHVCHFRHALALDERRIKFLPEYANGGAGPREGKAGHSKGKAGPHEDKAEPVGSNIEPVEPMAETVEAKPEPAKDKAGPAGRGHVKEVWFVGFHSDIGGGNVNNLSLKRFEASLRWESYEGISHGLKMEPYKGEWGPIEPVESLTGIWKLLELWPFRRLTYKDEDSTTYWPHLGDARIVQKGQLIHETVFEAIANPDRKYTPHARLWHDENGWDHLKDLKQKLMERDPYTSAVLIVSRLKEKNANNFKQIFDEQINELSSLLSEDIFCQSITEVPDADSILLSALETECERRTQEPQQSGNAVSVLLTVLANFPPRPLEGRKYTISELQDLASVSRPLEKGHQQLIFKVCRKFGNPLLYGPFKWHGNSIPRYCAFSCDGNHVFSGSDSSWAIWEEGTDKPEWKSYGEYTGKVWSVAFSADGTRIATGFRDGTVLVWDSSTGKVVKGPLKGHAESVSAIAFSPDGTHIASGSSDCTIRVWDVMTGEVIGSMEGHTDWVTCVAFSPNGTHIVSGSGDNTIRVWDVKTGKEVMGPLWGHTDWVHAVAYSPDGTRIVSGSSDSTIRVWNAGTGEEVMKPLEGHTSAVPAVTYSLDGRRIASGSWDETIRVWDAMTGKILGVLDVGSVVESVAFSPDGKRIVSGSWDYSTFNLQSFVHIWDAENPELWPDSHPE